MTNTLPERTAPAAELASESTREISCACGARRGYSCDGKGGMHLIRYADARKLGVITGPQMTVVLAAAGDVFGPDTIIPRGAR